MIEDAMVKKTKNAKLSFTKGFIVFVGVSI